MIPRTALEIERQIEMSNLITRMSGPQRGAALSTCGAALLMFLGFAGDTHISAQGQGEPLGDDAKIRIGFEISPVELSLRGRNPALVGLGSYIVNAQAACNECHTWPIFAPGGDPFLGQPEQINTLGYMGGGRPFGPIVSDNITPDPDTGLPAGMTFEEFEFVMRTGVDRDHSFPPVPSPDNDLMQVMPWPVFGHMSTRDLRAIYEYLSAIPSVP
jgi:hypothetical protein